MKKYVKPTFEFVELRPEEGLARCGSGKDKRNCSAGRRKCMKHSHYPKW